MASSELREALMRVQALLDKDEPAVSPALAVLWPVFYQTEARHLDSAQRSEWAWSELRGRVGADGIALENRPALSVTTEIVEEIRTQLRSTISRRGKVYSAATVNRHLVVLRRFINWCFEQRHIPYNPLASLAMEPEHNIRHGKLRTEEELQRLMAHCKPVLKALVLVLFDGGLRKSEVLNMRREQVFKKPNGGAIVELSADETKTDEPRQPHLTRRSVDALEAIPSTGPYYFAKRNGEKYCPRYLYTLFERARDKAGLTTIKGDTITLHSLRHSMSYIRRVRDKWPARLVMRQGGWKTNICELRYGDSDDDELSSGMDGVEARLAGCDRIGPQRAPISEAPTEVVREEKK